VVIFLLLPLTVYSLNLAEVTITREAIVKSALALTVYAMVLLVPISLVPRLGRLVQLGCAIAAISVFVLVVFPNRTGELADFEGAVVDQGWLPHIKLLALILAGVALAAWRQSELQLITSAVLVLSALASGYILIFERSELESTASRQTSAIVSATELGRDANIIVIIPDSFSGYRMAEVFQKRPELKRAFDGFTLYPRTIASALNTAAGISTILAGDLEFAVNEAPKTERTTRSLDASFMRDAVEQGFEAVFVSSLKSEAKNIKAYSELDFIHAEAIDATRQWPEYLSFWAVSLARVLPSDLHQYIVRLVGQFSVAETETSGAHSGDIGEVIPEQHQRYYLSRLAVEYLTHNLHVGPAKKKILFLHSKISHPPFIFDEDGEYKPRSGSGTAIFTTKLLKNYMARLRELKRYDNSLVIVVSDHGGTGVADKSYGGTFPADREAGPAASRFNRHNALLMVKPPHAKHPLRQSQMTVWLGDVAPTIRAYLDLESEHAYSYDVRSLLDEEDVSRELNIPLFVKPDDLGYHTALAGWEMVEARGTFADYEEILRSR
jgi:hypothetical protein